MLRARRRQAALPLPDGHDRDPEQLREVTTGPVEVQTPAQDRGTEDDARAPSEIDRRGHDADPWLEAGEDSFMGS